MAAILQSAAVPVTPALLPVPGPRFGNYPQRPSGQARHAGSMLDAPAIRLAAPGGWRAAERRRFVQAVRAAQAALPPLASSQFTQARRALQAQLGSRGFVDELLVQALAFVSHAAAGALGQPPYDTQLIAARILLNNRLAEMATGEGKTLATVLAAATAALAGVPVHVITANPYLAARDADAMAPVYAALGLRAAALVPGEAAPQRRAAYACDIVHATAPELVFDYLRDLDRHGDDPPMLRGLCMAFVDEADSVLIDEARTPFILARERDDPRASARHTLALAIAGGLADGADYRLHRAGPRAELTDTGIAAMADALAADTTSGDDIVWRNRRFAGELVEQALAALHLYRRDEHYLIRDGRVEIIDSTTGRIAVGRRWSHGLHQLVEIKEGLAASPLQHTSAQLTYQRFFPRYWRLAGTSGTLQESCGELWRVYRLEVETVPLRLPSRRSVEPPRLYAHSAARWAAAVETTARLQLAGMPVLIGTDTVADAETLSRMLTARGIVHQRLDACQDADEAARIAVAGSAGTVTVTTNIAGRGTDIRLGDGVAARGGLHLLACQHNVSSRIDRQLHGRCARAGDPGTVTPLLALDAGLLGQTLPRWLRTTLSKLAPARRPLPAWLARSLIRGVQATHENRGREQRAALLEADRRAQAGLGFGARPE